MQAARHTHDATNAVGLALVAGLFFRRVPFIRCIAARWTERNAREIAFGSGGHSIAPIFGDQRHPIAGDIDGGSGLGGRRRSGRAAATSLRAEVRRGH